MGTTPYSSAKSGYQIALRRAVLRRIVAVRMPNSRSETALLQRQIAHFHSHTKMRHPVSDRQHETDVEASEAIQEWKVGVQRQYLRVWKFVVHERGCFICDVQQFGRDIVSV
jgi:hypothetical protein